MQIGFSICTFLLNMELEEWFKDKDFAQGILLFEKLSPTSTFLISLFRKPKNSFSVAELEKHLTLLLANQKAQSTSLGKPKDMQAKEQNQKLIEAKKVALKLNQWAFDENISEDEEVKKLVANRKKLYVLRTQLKAKLNQATWYQKKFTNEERGTIAQDLTKICKDLEDCWKDTIHYRKTGKLPSREVELKIKDISPNELQKRLQTVRTYLSKFKKLDKQHVNEERYQAEADEINRILRTYYETNHQK